MSCVVEGFRYKGMPRLIIPAEEEGGHIICYQCMECGNAFSTSVLPSEIMFLVKTGTAADVKDALRIILPKDVYRSVFETGVCSRCEGVKKFSGNKIKESPYERYRIELERELYRNGEGQFRQGRSQEQARGAD